MGFITLSLMKTEINFTSDREIDCMLGTEQLKKKIFALDENIMLLMHILVT